MFSVASVRCGVQAGVRGVQAADGRRRPADAKPACVHAERARRGRAHHHRRLAVRGLRRRTARHPPARPCLRPRAAHQGHAGGKNQVHAPPSYYRNY